MDRTNKIQRAFRRRFPDAKVQIRNGDWGKVRWLSGKPGDLSENWLEELKAEAELLADDEMRGMQAWELAANPVEITEPTQQITFADLAGYSDLQLRISGVQMNTRNSINLKVGAGDVWQNANYLRYSTRMSMLPICESGDHYSGVVNIHGLTEPKAGALIGVIEYEYSYRGSIRAYPRTVGGKLPAGEQDAIRILTPASMTGGEITLLGIRKPIQEAEE